jgi:hypothetical protein
VSSLPSLFLHNVFASRHLHIQVSRNDSTVPTRCRHRSGIVDPAGYTACRALRQTTSPSNQILDPKSSKTSQFSVIRRFVGIDSHASKSYYHSYTVATSGANRLASQICHNRFFRKKLQQNILPMISTEVSSLAAHNKRKLFAKTQVCAESCRVIFLEFYLRGSPSCISHPVCGLFRT